MSRSAFCQNNFPNDNILSFEDLEIDRNLSLFDLRIFKALNIYTFKQTGERKLVRQGSVPLSVYSRKISFCCE